MITDCADNRLEVESVLRAEMPHVPSATAALQVFLTHDKWCMHTFPKARNPGAVLIMDLV